MIYLKRGLQKGYYTLSKQCFEVVKGLLLAANSGPFSM